MRKKFILGLAVSFFLAGCSPDSWIAKFYLVRAESKMDQAGDLRSHKTPFEKRISYYAEACGYFAQAYERNPDVFSLARIEAAADCCWKAGNETQEQLFRQFEEIYIKNHPQEYEYGDSGMGMMDMGG